MVQKNRAAQKATFAKDVSPMRNMNFNKYAQLSSSPSGGFHLGSRLAAPVATTPSACNSSNNKWQYNNMVNNQRDKFNNLHFC